MPTATPPPAIACFTANNASMLKGPACNRVITNKVACLIEDVFQKCGLNASQYNLTDANVDVLDGYVLPQRVEGSRAIQEVLRVYKLFLVEVDGVLKVVKRGAAVVTTISDDDLGAHTGRPEEPTTKRFIKRKQPTELPARVDLTFFSADTKYEQASASATRLDAPHYEAVTINTPLVLTATVARQAAEFILYDIWNSGKELQLFTTWKYAYLAPGDAVNITVAGALQRYRIVSADLAFFGIMVLNLVLEDAGTLTQSVGGGVLPTHTDEVTLATVTALFAWTTNALRDVDTAATGATPGFYWVAGTTNVGQDWPGCTLYISRDSGATFQVVDSLTDAGDFGTTLTALPAGTAFGTGQFDTVNTVDIRLQSGQAPVSASLAEVLNGVNAAMIGDEMIQYQTVTALGGNDYRLSNLLRGRRGTNNFWGTHVIGERAVLLDNGGNTFRVDVEQGLIGKTVQLKAVTAGSTLAATTAVNLLITGRELFPYDGVDKSNTRNVPAANDWTVTWKRRTRCGGSWADLKDADLCEATEAYEAEVWDTGFTSLKRTITGLTTPSFVYTAAQQTTDFGSPQATFGVRVYQIGATGRGYVYQFIVVE